MHNKITNYLSAIKTRIQPRDAPMLLLRTFAIDSYKYFRQFYGACRNSPMAYLPRSPLLYRPKWSQPYITRLPDHMNITSPITDYYSDVMHAVERTKS